MEKPKRHEREMIAMRQREVADMCCSGSSSLEVSTQVTDTLYILMRCKGHDEKGNMSIVQLKSTLTNQHPNLYTIQQMLKQFQPAPSTLPTLLAPLSLQQAPSPLLTWTSLRPTRKSPRSSPELSRTLERSLSLSKHAVRR